MPDYRAKPRGGLVRLRSRCRAFRLWISRNGSTASTLGFAPPDGAVRKPYRPLQSLDFQNSQLVSRTAGQDGTLRRSQLGTRDAVQLTS